MANVAGSANPHAAMNWNQLYKSSQGSGWLLLQMSLLYLLPESEGKVVGEANQDCGSR
jgi:hypothetical protein